MAHNIRGGSDAFCTGGKEATCKVTVRANSCKLDEAKLVLYQGQETTAKLTSKKKAKSYSYYISNADETAYDVILAEGKTKKLKVTGAEEDSKITFQSSDKTVASVTKTGKITAKKSGAALITVTIDGRSLYCTIIVGTGKGGYGSSEGRDRPRSCIQPGEAYAEGLL